jgi:hypothetical protein
MTMTRTQFAPIWQNALRSWPGTKPVEGTALRYADMLAPFTPNEVAAAFDRLTLTSSEWFPPIAAVWQECVAARDQAPDWHNAWTEALEHSSGATSRPWTHEAVAEAYRTIGGWNLRQQPSGEGVTRAHFRDAYQAILERRRGDYASGARALPPPAALAIESRS